ncbi:MAG: transposase [Alphaproteobacteria bacterium]|nr:transposase [Alphaproteobacteria bacterium]
MDDHLGYENYEHSGKSGENSRNRHSKKHLKTDDGSFEISVPRDRKSDFEPQILRKRQTYITPEIETKILSMYAKGMTVRDISSHIEDIYGIPISESLLSDITDKIITEAINAIYQETDVQHNSTKYVSYKYMKELVGDLKKIYRAVDENTAINELDAFEEKWGKEYSYIGKSWRSNWAELSTYFKYPENIRKIIYTTNLIEGFNRQLRKVSKTRSVFPTDESLLKLLYLATKDITKKWTGIRPDWNKIIMQLDIFYGERISKYYL